MNVFVLSTGRCGSTSFIAACRHISNFSAAHESRTGKFGESRLAYPENHIEADNRLSWLLGRLDQRYGDAAYYVHLSRNAADTAQSYCNRYFSGIMRAYRGSGILMGLPEDSDRMSVALDYCETVNSNIAMFLRDKTNQIHVTLENIRADFTEFWHWIGAQGDLALALAEFGIKHHATRPLPMGDPTTTVRYVLRKARRIVKKFPSYLKNA
jgi:hypothetical protein